MSEHISSCQILETQQVGEEALATIDQTYGSGYPLWEAGQRELSYHNGHHGRIVGETALKLCNAIGLSPLEAAVAQTAGYAHDIVQLKGRGVDETQSALWLEAQLEHAGHRLPDNLRRMGAMAIHGTEPIFLNNQLVGQMATEMDYPDRSTELVAKSVASGDFGDLYTPQGPYVGHQLFREINGMPVESDIPFEKMTGFQRGQVGLLERYEYPLPEADRLLATHRPQVIAYVQDTLQKLESGTIETWRELLQRDEAFMRQHA